MHKLAVTIVAQRKKCSTCAESGSTRGCTRIFEDGKAAISLKQLETVPTLPQEEIAQN